MSQTTKETRRNDTQEKSRQGGARLMDRRPSNGGGGRRLADRAPKGQTSAKQAEPAEERPRYQAAIPAWEEVSLDAPAPPRRPRRTKSTQPPETRREREQQERGLHQAIGQKFRRIRRRWRRILREERASRFPESERLAIRFLLFIWGMIPMWASLLEARTFGRRQRAHAKPVRNVRFRIHPAAFLAVACCVAGVALFFSTYTYGTTVTYDGEVIAVLPSQEEAEAVRHDLEAITAKTLGQTFTISDDLIQYSSGLLRRSDLTDVADYAEDLSDEIGLVIPAYCLYVDGERIGATPYEGALNELLNQLRSSASDENTISCEFAEGTSVEIKDEYVPSDEIVNLGSIVNTLYSTKSAEVTYEVKKGDTWSQIAQDHGLTNEELLALNPGFDINKLSIGEVLTMSASVPYLTMTVVQRERYVQEVNYDIEYTDTADMYQGDYQVTSKGEFGAADVVANVTYVNGEETERTVLSSVTLREPVTEHQLRGTTPRPTWYPTGTFRWPASGRISSYFGGRKSPGGIGSTNHQGIDIAAGYGSPVYAADGGVVSYAGWSGGYGYLVRINHTNGYETYYAHNSSLLVSVGDHVYKGQQIAKVGSTGNSTGPHCHFEVRYNGVAKDPLGYLP